MLSGTDDAAFAAVMQDLCLAFNRPYSAELSRVFWEGLRWAHIADVKRAATKWRDTSKKFPTPRDLAPERATRYVAPKAADPAMSTWAVAANKILFAVAYLDKSRGFRPMADALPACLAAKADYVRMAEEAAADGEPWETEDFNRLCREGFQKLLGGKAA